VNSQNEQAAISSSCSGVERGNPSVPRSGPHGPQPCQYSPDWHLLIFCCRRNLRRLYYVHNDGTNSWLLVGCGRDGWQFDNDGQGSPAAVGVQVNLGTSSAFEPTLYSDAIINRLLVNAGSDRSGDSYSARGRSDWHGPVSRGSLASGHLSHPVRRFRCRPCGL